MSKYTQSSTGGSAARSRREKSNRPFPWWRHTLITSSNCTQKYPSLFPWVKFTPIRITQRAKIIVLPIENKNFLAIRCLWIYWNVRIARWNLLTKYWIWYTGPEKYLKISSCLKWFQYQRKWTQKSALIAGHLLWVVHWSFCWQSSIEENL